MIRNLIITGGIVHPFAASAPALARLLARSGVVSTITEDVEGGLADLGSYDLLTVYALRWSMTQHEKYAPDRARWALRLSSAGREAITGHLARGRGLFGLHTASICFDDWPEWRGVLGGAWVWGRSGHPPFGPVRARVDRPDHALLRGLADFELNDEVYGDLAIESDVVPLAHARAKNAPWHPVLWERRVGRGRVVYDALGHDAAALDHPVHARIVARCALLAAGRPEHEVEMA